MTFIDVKDDIQMEHEEFSDVITRVSEDIIIDNIISQIEKFKEPEFLGNRKSLFGYIEDRFTYLVNKYGTEVDKVDSIKIVFDKILDDISDAIEKEISTDIEYSQVLSLNDKFDYVKSLYEFFIINIEDELVDLVVNYTVKNKKSLSELFNSNLHTDERKNLSYNYLRNSIDNEYTTMIYHIDTVIETMDIQFNEEIIELMTLNDEEEFTNFTVNRILVDNVLVDCDYKDILLDVFKPLLVDNKTIERKASLRLIDLLG